MNYLKERQELYQSHRKCYGLGLPSREKKKLLEIENDKTKNKYMNEMTDEEIKKEYNTKIEQDIKWIENDAIRQIEKLKSKML